MMAVLARVADVRHFAYARASTIGGQQQTALWSDDLLLHVGSPVLACSTLQLAVYSPLLYTADFLL